MVAPSDPRARRHSSADGHSSALCGTAQRTCCCGVRRGRERQSERAQRESGGRRRPADSATREPLRSVARAFAPKPCGPPLTHTDRPLPAPPLPTTPTTDKTVIVKASSGPRYVVGVRAKVDRAKLTPGTRVALDMTTLTIMRYLPREVDPVVFNMLSEDPGKVDYASIGGLGEQVRSIRESIELPLMNPELFVRVGIKPPKGE